MKTILLYVTFIAILGLFLGCEIPEDFKGLNWDIEVNIPLMNNSYPIYDIEDGEYFVVEDTSLALFYEDTVNTDEVSANLRLRGEKSSSTRDVIPFMPDILISVPIDESGIDDDDIDITYAEVSSGIINIEVTDAVDELEEIIITFLDIITPHGIPYEARITSFDEQLFYEDISDCSIGIKDGTAVLDSLSFEIAISHQPYANSLAKLRIFIDEPMYFSYFEGFLVNQNVPIDDRTLDTKINYPNNIGKAFKVEEAQVSFTFNNELGFDALFIGTIIGINTKDNQEFRLTIDKTDNILAERSNSSDESSVSTVILKSDELNDLVSIFPNIIKLTEASMLVGNRDNERGFAHSTNMNYGSFKVSTPSVFTVFSQTIVPDTVFSITIDEENREFIDEYPEDIKMYLNLTNTTPLSATVDLYFSSSADTLHLFHTTPDNVQTISFLNIYVSGSSDDSQPVLSPVEFSMTKEDLKLFLNEEVYFAIKITFDESNGPIIIKPEHFLNIMGQLSVKLNIDI